MVGDGPGGRETETPAKPAAREGSDVGQTNDSQWEVVFAGEGLLIGEKTREGVLEVLGKQSKEENMALLKRLKGA